MKEQTLKFGDVFPGTVVQEDPAEGALRIEVQDPAAQYTAFVRWGCEPTVSVDTHPVVAFCVKLGRPDLKFWLCRWRMDNYAKLMEAFGGPHTFWSIFPKIDIHYDPTTDWQLVTMDGSLFENPNFDGHWTDLGLVLAQKDGTLQPGDHLWLKWVGVFVSKDAAQAYFNYGQVFEDPTPLFWHAESTPVVEKPLFPAMPTMSHKEAARRINNYGVTPQGKVPCEWVNPTAFDENMAFAHHPGMTMFKGELFVSSSAGIKDEDVAGQHMRIYSSKDFVNWKEPVDFEVSQGTHGKTCHMPSHMYATDEALYAYYEEHEYGPSCFDENGEPIGKDMDNAQPGEILNRRVMRRTTTDGANWSEPEQVPMSYWTNEAPRPAMDGWLFAGAGPKVARTKDSRGFDIELVGPTAEQYQNALNRGAPLLTESTWYQMDNGLLRMFLRSNAGYLWMSESYDNGDTWTEILPTRFANDATMANMGRLPDGRYYYVGTPVWNNGRFPLALCLSDDGYTFDKMYVIRDDIYELKIPGWAKGGQYGYPEVLIRGDYMYITYSRVKEVMEVARIKLSDI